MVWRSLVGNASSCILYQSLNGWYFDNFTTTPVLLIVCIIYLNTGVVDINCDTSDCNYQTALEVLCELTSQTAREIAYVISGMYFKKLLTRVPTAWNGNSGYNSGQENRLFRWDGQIPFNGSFTLAIFWSERFLWVWSDISWKFIYSHKQFLRQFLKHCNSQNCYWIEKLLTWMGTALIWKRAIIFSLQKQLGKSPIWIVL